jgi:hypothetical protein
LVFGSGTAPSAQGLSWHAVVVDETSYGYFARGPLLDRPAAERLKYFAPFLQHANRLVAEDAYQEFGHAPFELVVEVAPAIAQDRVRRWLVDPAVPPERKGFYGLLLGLATGDSERRANAALLKPLILAPADDFRAGFDGILGGYLLLAGPAALELVEARYLGDPQAADGDVRHALAALRFYQEYGREIPSERLHAAVARLLARPEFAEAATIDLARWQAWEVLDRVVDCYGRAEYDTPGMRRAVVGYLLACPQPAAAKSLLRLRAADPRGVAEAEAVLSRTTTLPSGA